MDPYQLDPSAMVDRTVVGAGHPCEAMVGKLDWWGNCLGDEKI